jgi:hypothetical protein
LLSSLRSILGNDYQAYREHMRLSWGFERKRLVATVDSSRWLVV